MTSKTFQLRRMTIQMGAAALLAACGSGGDNPTPTPTPTPTPPAPLPELSLLAGEHGNTGRADGIGQEARFSRIFDAKIDSKGTIYVSEPRSTGSGQDYYSGYAVRSVERDGTVRTMYMDPPRAPLDPIHSPDGPQLSIDARDQVYSTVLSSSYLLAKDGTATPLDIRPGPDTFITSADGIAYRHSWTAIYRIEANGSSSLLAGCEDLIPLPNQTPPPPCPTGEARLHFIRRDSMVLDPAGNLYLVDMSRIRKVTPQGVLSTLAGAPLLAGGLPEAGPARDGSGSAARFVDPAHMVYHDGQLLVIDDFVLRRVSLDGVVTTSALALPDARALLRDREGKLYVVFSQHISLLGPGDKLTLFAGKPNLSETSVDGIGAAARLRGPHGLALTPSGTLYAIERPRLIHDATGAHPLSGIRLRRIAADGTVASLFRAAGIPSGIASDKAGNVYISTLSGSYPYSAEFKPFASQILKLGTDGEWSVFAGADDIHGRNHPFLAPHILGFDKTGELYVQDAHQVLYRIRPDGVTVRVDTGVPPEVGAAFDEAGNRYVTDAAANTVTRITPAGVSTIVAGKAGPLLAVPGAAPLALDNPRGIVRIGDKRFALISGNAIVKLSLP